jgi:hypothetical protein
MGYGPGFTVIVFVGILTDVPGILTIVGNVIGNIVGSVNHLSQLIKFINK